MKNYIIGALVLIVLIIGYVVAKNMNGDSDLISADYKVKIVDAEDVTEIKKGTTYEEIIETLGRTKDVGGKTHIAKYQVNESYIYLVFENLSDECMKTGEDILNDARPIHTQQIGIRGTITNVYQGTDSITILVEGPIEVDTVYDKASVLVNEGTVLVDEEGNDLPFAALALNVKVEVVFNGAVAESYPVQGTAARITVLE